MIDLSRAQADPEMTPIRLAVLLAVARLAEVSPSVDQLADAAKVSRRSATAALEWLAAGGWVEVERKPGQRSSYQCTRCTRAPAAPVQDVHTWVDARQGTVEPEIFSRWVPRHLFSLHWVPGRSQPLCVRRRVLFDQDRFLTIEHAGAHRPLWLNEDTFAATGRARTSGRRHETDDDENYLEHPMLEPAFWLFDHEPTAEDVAWWRTRRVAEQAFLALRRTGQLRIWISFASPTEGPDLTILVHARSSDDARGEIAFDRSGRERKLDVFDLVDGVLSRGSYDDPMRVSFEPIPAELLAEDGRKRWQHHHDQERWKREAEERQRAQREQARVPWEDILTGARPPSKASLALLGLSWPCTAEELKTAFRKRVLEHHPDRGGDPTKMAKVNQANDEIGKLIRERGSA